MKPDKRILIKFLPVVMFFVAIGVVMFFVKFNHKPIDPDKLPKYDSPISAFSIESSGDINGGYSKIAVIRNDENAVITSVLCEKSGNPEKIQSYIASSELLNKLEEMFYQNGMIEWDKNENRKYSSSDSVGYNLVFTFGKDETSFSSSKIPSRNSSLSELFSLIESYEKNDNTGVIIKDVFNEDGLNIYNLNNGYLDAEIANNDSTDRSFSTSFELFRNVDDEWVLLEAVSPSEISEFAVPASSSVSVQFDLNAFGKLESGDYKLVCGNANAEFSIE